MSKWKSHLTNLPKMFEYRFVFEMFGYAIILIRKKKPATGESAQARKGEE